MKRSAALVFVVAVVGYGLVSWDGITQASPHFHFVDLAHSLMNGRLDTDTPRQRKTSKPSDDDPRGYREAITRTLDGGGWNDWASIKTLTLKSPQVLDDGVELHVLRGRYPWADEDGERRHLFHTTDGFEIKVEPHRDLARTCGKTGRARCDETTHYISFPPMPAVIMMPFAAIWGYDTNDVLITVLFAGLNAALVFLLLQLLVTRGYSERSVNDNLWLTCLFAFGSVVFFSSVRGEVWFTALVFGVTFNLLYILAALDTKHPLLAGLCLGLGMATRTPIAFCFVFFAWQLFFPGNRWQAGRIKEILVKGTLFALPILAVGITLMVYNNARFDSPMEFGHSFLSGGAAARIRDHGLFDSFFLNGNLSAALTNLPRFTDVQPYVQVSKHGLGMLFTTPALALLLWPRARPTVRRALWVAVACAAIPGLLYQNSGWEQFGFRFSMDYLPYLVALLAVGGVPIDRKVKALIVFGVLVNLFGAITFGRFPGFYY